MNLNKVMLGGNLTRDPELRHLPNGNTAICSFGLAVNEKWKDKDGNQKEAVVFVDCEAWGKTGEAISQYMNKGKPIFVEGKLRLDSWKDKTDGTNRTKLKVVVDSFQFIGGKSEGGGTADALHAPAKPRTARPAAHPEPIQEEDIPFSPSHHFC
jgi:single-strand DNA-binding protein